MGLWSFFSRKRDRYSTVSQYTWPWEIIQKFSMSKAIQKYVPTRNILGIGLGFWTWSICPSRCTVYYSHPALYPGRLPLINSIHGFICPMASSCFQPMGSIATSLESEKRVNLRCIPCSPHARLQWVGCISLPTAPVLLLFPRSYSTWSWAVSPPPHPLPF